MTDSIYLWGHILESIHLDSSKKTIYSFGNEYTFLLVYGSCKFQSTSKVDEQFCKSWPCM